MEKPTTTSRLVKEEIDKNIFVKESLKESLINYSALTRKILPKVKKKNNKANFSSVLISIQRYHDQIGDEGINKNIKKILSNSEVIMKNNICSLTVERDLEAIKKVEEISKDIRWDLGDILFFIQGSGEVTIIIDNKNKSKFGEVNSKIIEKREDLATLSLRENENLKKYSKDTKGYLALLTNKLAEKDINIVDITSTYKQIIFILDEKDLTKAYNEINKLIKS